MKTRTFKLNKLVRDKIVPIHLEMGGEVSYKTVKDNKLTKALLTKLIEETRELKASDFAASELADLQELVDALANHLGLTKKEISKLQAEKRRKNGGFKKGHYIDTVTLPANNKWAKYYTADPKRFPELN